MTPSGRPAFHAQLPGSPVGPAGDPIPPQVARSKSVLAGLVRDDLFTIVHEQFATDTVDDYADLVLPATTQLEHFDLHTAYGHH